MSKFDTSEELLKIAEKDIQSSRLLFNHKYYSQSVFYLQQSVEKLNKALGLTVGQISEEELKRNIGHFTMKIHEKSIKKSIEDFKRYSDFSEKFPSIKSKTKPHITLQEIKSGINIIEWAKNSSHKIMSISAEDLKEDLKEINKAYREFEKMISMNIKPDKINMQDLKEGCKEVLSSLIEKYPELDEKLDQKFAKVTPEMMALSVNVLSKAMAYLYPAGIASAVLSVYTSPHAIKSRYPDNNSNFSPLTFYNGNLGLIKLMPEIFDIQEKSIKHLKQFKRFIEGSSVKNKNKLRAKKMFL